MYRSNSTHDSPNDLLDPVVERGPHILQRIDPGGRFQPASSSSQSDYLSPNVEAESSHHLVPILVFRVGDPPPCK